MSCQRQVTFTRERESNISSMPPFLELLLLVRERIYSFLLDNREVCVRREVQSGYAWPVEHSCRYHFQVNILRTCKAIYAEAAYIFRNANKFVLVTHNDYMDGYLDEWSCPYFTGNVVQYTSPHLEIRLTFDNQYQPNPTISHFMLLGKDLPQLALTIVTAVPDIEVEGEDLLLWKAEMIMGPKLHGKLPLAVQRRLLGDLSLFLAFCKVPITGQIDSTLHRVTLEMFKDVLESAPRRLLFRLDYLNDEAHVAFRSRKFARARALYELRRDPPFNQPFYGHGYCEPGHPDFLQLERQRKCNEYIASANEALATVHLLHQGAMTWTQPLEDEYARLQRIRNKDADREMPRETQQVFAWAHGAMRFACLATEPAADVTPDALPWFEQALSSDWENHAAIGRCIGLCREYNENLTPHKELMAQLLQVMPQQPCTFELEGKLLLPRLNATPTPMPMFHAN